MPSHVGEACSSTISRMRRPSLREHTKRIKRKAGHVGVMLRCMSPQLARLGPKQMGRVGPLCPGTSDLNLLGKG
jgi:hypothetical protein